MDSGDPARGISRRPSPDSTYNPGVRRTAADPQGNRRLPQNIPGDAPRLDEQRTPLHPERKPRPVPEVRGPGSHQRPAVKTEIAILLRKISPKPSTSRLEPSSRIACNRTSSWPKRAAENERPRQRQLLQNHRRRFREG
jgi:hypothetical protein